MVRNAPLIISNIHFISTWHLLYDIH